LTTVLAAAGSSIRKSKALPVPRRNKDFKEQYEVLKKKRMIRVQLYGSTSDCDKTNEVVRLVVAFLKISLLLNSAAQSVLQLEVRDATQT
jgi:hypothetical protein